MASFGVVLQALQQERNRMLAQLNGVNAALAALRGQRSGGGTKVSRAAFGEGRRKLSAAAIAGIRAGQKKRWAKYRKAHKKS